MAEPTIADTRRFILLTKVPKKIALKEKDIVLDIGCNDGTLLRSYQKNQIQLVGFEPSNLYKEAVYSWLDSYL